MDSSETTEDDTIRDKMESGYVATRPRSTRARRTWNINHRFLTEEDARSLINFRDQGVLRGALPFYYPNLFKNSSFEIAPDYGSNDVAQGWTAALVENVNVGSVGRYGTIDRNSFGSAGAEGSVAIAMYCLNTNAGSAQFMHATSIACAPGDTYLVNCTFWKIAANTPAALAAGTGFAVSAAITFDDGTTAVVSSPLNSMLAPNTLGFAPLSTTFTIPDSPTSFSGTMVVSFELAAAGGTFPLDLFVDAVGLALTSRRFPRLTMAGTSRINTLVRFASGGLPQISDMGWSGGRKAYGATFKLEEV